jgi:hypothetical protein
MLRALLTELRARAPDRLITLTHTDLRHNDFSALFRLVHGLLPGREHDGLRDFGGVFHFASGTSFHQQIFPNATLSLGFSATAGGASEVEVKERKDRVDDALHATRAAVEEGVVPGGGVPLARASLVLSKLKVDNDDQRFGIEIVRKAVLTDPASTDRRECR